MPATLAGRGASETRENGKSYDDAPEEYSSGQKKFNIRSSIYSHNTVRTALVAAHHEKCCYCETIFRQGYSGAVEHFRPKGTARQARGQPRLRPGYYWLAYKWDNLLFACGECNTAKSDLFPLANGNERARNHHDDTAVERPLLIDPSLGNPREDIRFRRDAPYGVTPRGRESIKVLNLDRLPLTEDRLKTLDYLRVLRGLSQLPEVGDQGKYVAWAKAELERAVEPQAKYSSMAMDFLAPNPDLPEGGQHAGH